MSHDARAELAAEATAAIAELVEDATALAPLIAPPPWEPAASPTPGLSFEAPADRAAWVQLGATIEAIDVAGSSTGLAFSVDPYAGEPPLPVIATSTTMSMSSHRLAACLKTPAGSFREAPLRLAAHVSARLASAAALHRCTLVWFESSSVIAELSAVLPTGASAIGVVTTATDDRG